MIVGLLQSPFKPHRWLNWCQLNFDSLSPTSATHFWQIAVWFWIVTCLFYLDKMSGDSALHSDSIVVMSLDSLWSYLSCLKQSGQCVNSLLHAISGKLCARVQTSTLVVWSLGWDKANSQRNMVKLRIAKAELWIIHNVKDAVKNEMISHWAY